MTLFPIEVMIENENHRAVLYDISVEADYERFNDLLQNNAFVFIHDRLADQISDLVKCRRPDLHLAGDLEGLKQEVVEFMKTLEYDRYGVWAHYPWSGRVVRILPEKEFIEVRTNRNKHKITQEEQDLLSSKKIGVVGLSVGQSVAITLAIERIAGELRIADMDHLDLSNLNRLRTGVHNLGVNKSVMVAREIAEIDPFLKVKIFTEGLHDGNIDAFFKEGGTIDLLHEECDDIYIKLLAREKAKDIGIPVIMEASDKCTIDIERYDLDKNRPMLHGLIGDLTSQDLKQISSRQEAMSIMLDMVEVDQLSARVKASITELGSSIGTWPQLASAVLMGGGVTSDLSRQILLGNFSHSGRYQVDIDEIFEIPNPGSSVDSGKYKKEEQGAIVNKYLRSHPEQISDLNIPDSNFRNWSDQIFHTEEASGHIFLFCRDELDSLTRIQVSIIAGFIAQMVGGDESVTELFPVPGHPDLVAVIRSMDSEYVRTEGHPLVTGTLRSVISGTASQQEELPVAELRRNLLSEYGLAQLSGIYNPYLSGNNSEDLLLRLIRQRGVSQLIQKWGRGEGINQIIQNKTDRCIQEEITVRNDRQELLELGRILAREQQNNNYQYRIGFAYVKKLNTNQGLVEEATIAIGLLPFVQKENQASEKYVNEGSNLKSHTDL